MMRARGGRGAGLIVLTLVAALLLALLPMPDWAAPFRPPWVALALLYWALALPQRVGVFTAFTCGILLDVVTGTLLGQHALSLSVVTYLAVVLHRRMRLFPWLQQTLSVGMLLLLERLLFLWLLGATGQPMPPPLYWATAVSGTLLWPWVYWLLGDLSRRARVG